MKYLSVIIFLFGSTALGQCVGNNCTYPRQQKLTRYTVRYNKETFDVWGVLAGNLVVWNPNLSENIYLYSKSKEVPNEKRGLGPEQFRPW